MPFSTLFFDQNMAQNFDEKVAQNFDEKVAQNFDESMAQKSKKTWLKISMTVIAKILELRSCCHQKNQTTLHVVVKKLKFRSMLSLKNSNYNPCSCQ